MQNKIDKVALEALTRQARGMTYRLIDQTDPSKGGTVIAINIGDRYFLATAAHVILKGHKFKIVLRNELGVSLDSFSSHYVDTDADVGLLEIKEDDYKYISNSCASLSSVFTQIQQDKENEVAIIGYPGQYISAHRKQITKQDILEVQIYNTLSYLSFTLPPERWPSDGLEHNSVAGRDIFIDFDPDGDMFMSSPDTVDITSENSLKCPKLFGMSGGGIWLLESKKGQIWQPDVKLIGIQHSVSEKGNWIRGSLIKSWLQLVARKYLDLKAHIGPFVQ
ncbi:MAG: hypothetical protein NTX52_02040 [Planctomycetota bacterium]|nr:hypothetical protein [Planctomycetota bacterium]